VTLQIHFERQVAFAVFGVDKLHVEALRHHRQDHFQRVLCESFAKADTLSSIERQPGESAAPLTGWGSR